MSLKVKGQVFSSDFLIAVCIFLLAFSIFYIYWSYSVKRIEETRMINNLIEKAYSLSNIWFREGVPEYWDPSNVNDLGLSNQHRFNRTKMDSLNDPLLGYKKISEIIGSEVYNYTFLVVNLTNQEVYRFPSGSNPTNSDNLVKVKRIGILDGKIVILEVMVW